MSNASPLSPMALQQDYLWGLVIFGWLLVAAGWWLTSRRDHALAWVPFAALAGAYMAGVELSLLATPVKPKPFIPSRLAWDAALGAGLWFLAAGLLWAGVRRRGARVVVAIVLAAGVGLAVWTTRDVKPVGWDKVTPAGAKPTDPSIRAIPRVDAEQVSGWRPRLIARVVTVTKAGNSWAAPVAVALAAAVLGWRLRRRLEGAALCFVVAGAFVATTGPLANALGLERHSTQLSALGPWSALVQLVALGLVAFPLVRREVERHGTVRADLRRDVKQVAWGLACWLFLGFWLASAMGYFARRDFEESLVARATVSAPLIDAVRMAEASGPGFKIDKFETVKSARGDFQRARVSYFASGILQPLEQALARIGTANRDVNSVRLVTIKDGYLMLFCAMANEPGPRTSLLVIRPVNDVDRERWSSPAPFIERPQQFHYAELLLAAAPVLGVDGAMLGWLRFEVGAAAWVASQAQARLQAFLVVGLGCGLIVLFQMQRGQARLRAKAHQAELVASEADRAKTAFLAKVSHELRTPVQSISGYAELLAGEPLSEGARRWLALQQSQSQLLIRLVNDLLDLAGIQSGVFQLRPRPARLAEVVASTVEGLRPKADAKGLALTCTVSPEIAAADHVVDVDRFQQVVINLTNNALKFTERGSVDVALNLTSPPEGTAQPDMVELVVTDTGPGISPEDQLRLFKPFTRLNPEDKVEGTGLGLALTAGLAGAMGGGVRVESDGETGSRFFAWFRLARAGAGATAAAPVETGARRSLAGCRVLVADDNETVRTLFVTALTSQGALCEYAEDGAAAYERVLEAEFDVLVLDLSMPWLEGKEVARRLRKELRRPLRIVGVSAHADEAERAAALAAGMDDFLVKPVSFASLGAAVANQAGQLLDEAQVPPEVVASLQAKFAAAAPGLLREIQEAAAARDHARLAQRVHYLKNGADALGLRRLGDECARIEAVLRGAAGSAPIGDALPPLLAQLAGLVGEIGAEPPRPHPV